LTPIAVLVYAAVLRRYTATTEQVAADVGIEKGRAEEFLEKLASLEGCSVYRLGNRAWRSWHVAAPKGSGENGSLGAAKNTLSSERVFRASYLDPKTLTRSQDRGDAARAPARDPAPVYSRSSLLKAFGYTGRCETKSELTGLFILRWEEAYGIEYRPPANYARDVWYAEQVLTAERTLARWCIEALFDKQLEWLASKTLEFVANHGHRNKHVRHVAVKLMKAAGGGMAPVGQVGGGYTNIPDGGSR